MKEETARRLSRLMLRVGEDLNDSLRAVRETEQEQEYRRYRSTVAKILTTMLTEVMNPIYGQWPGLRPPELPEPPADHVGEDREVDP